MNPVIVIGVLIGGFVVLFIIRILMLVTPIAAKVQASPWWVYVVVGLIVVSGSLTFKYGKEDRENEQRWIEQEGELFLEPIRKQRKEMSN